MVYRSKPLLNQTELDTSSKLFFICANSKSRGHWAPPSAVPQHNRTYTIFIQHPSIPVSQYPREPHNLTVSQKFWEHNQKSKFAPNVTER